MRRAKVLDMPEEQYLGALERAVDRLSSEVQGALEKGEQARDPFEQADEAAAILERARRGRPSGGRARRKGKARR